ncbi:MAG: nucleotidyltransferase family protein [Gammaproteobacteria bacterium]|nr:nucleotidyltransferase family protein [Gammaproteobacteria bacterium]NNF60757.1 nucleotidyltransferase family protein [Gammaproteobacteria bacterium]NNM20232.1 nucleotidyltransferase family protein [Gammaproteobacteria bacterium]
MPAIILSAGRGHRLRPLTDHVPKPLLQVGAEVLLGRHLRALSSSGVRRVVINVAWHGQLIRHFVGDGTGSGVEIAISDEGSTALETGGGIFRALPLLGAGPFISINADVWTDFDFSAFAPPAGDDLATLVLVANPEHNPDGDFALANDRVVSEGERYTFSGIAMLRPELFADSDEGIYSIVPLLREAIRAGRVRGQLHCGAWFDCGAPERLAAARHYAATHRK